MSLILSFAYFTHFSNLNISGTNVDISKLYVAFLIFPRILCDKSKTSRDINLIIVALYNDFISCFLNFLSRLFGRT